METAMSSEPSDDARFMRRAIVIARRPGVNPIGCVIVLDGEIVGEGHNEVDIRHDPTAHAEIVAMRQAGETLGQFEFRGATLCSTLQPCGMCTMASIWARIGRIVYGAERDQVHPRQPPQMSPHADQGSATLGVSFIIGLATRAYGLPRGLAALWRYP
jgi:tRNA(Arg) A34 adenosine deaminase TadA